MHSKFAGWVPHGPIVKRPRFKLSGSDIKVQDAESQKILLGNANSCKQNLQRLQLIKGASAGIAGVVNLARPGQDGQGTSHQKTGFFLVSTCSTQTAKAAKTVDTTFCPPGPAPSPSLLSSCFCSGGLSRTRAP